MVKGDKQATGSEADYEYFRVWDKMRFKSKDDKSTIIYNGNITIENIPAKAYEYVVNGKSAIEWIVELFVKIQRLLCISSLCLEQCASLLDTARLVNRRHKA